ncbi:MAG: S41 family peptidase [Dehalococcoidia bacterium]|nr:S41 family peptidase [Dehalococcoidia bacterium]
MLYKNKVLLVAVIVLAIALSTFSFAAGVGANIFFNIGHPRIVTSTDAGSFQKLSEIWGILNHDYVDRDSLDLTNQVDGAARGMLASLNDPFTSYLDAEHYALESENLHGKFEGIGANVGMDAEGRVVIISPMPDSPAEKAGIKAGDIVVKVDGQAVDGLSLNELVLKIRGPRNTMVTLEVIHRGDTVPVIIEIIRGEIKLTSVSFKMIDDTAYIKINSFSDNTNDELLPYLKKALENDARDMIIDLRFNPGGLLDTVVAVTSNFLTDGDIVLHTVDSEKHKTTTRVRKDGILKNIPLAVLINEFSASGSEVMSGSLQDNKRAVLIGTETFGKGSVNITRPLSDGSAVIITVARWLTPSGRQIATDKIQPDIKVTLPDGHDVTSDDIQLQKTLEYLEQKTSS